MREIKVCEVWKSEGMHAHVGIACVHVYMYYWRAGASQLNLTTGMIFLYIYTKRMQRIVGPLRNGVCVCMDGYAIIAILKECGGAPEGGCS